MWTWTHTLTGGDLTERLSTSTACWPWRHAVSFLCVLWDTCLTSSRRFSACTHTHTHTLRDEHTHLDHLTHMNRFTHLQQIVAQDFCLLCPGDTQQTFISICVCVCVCEQNNKLILTQRANERERKEPDKTFITTDTVVLSGSRQVGSLIVG